MLGTGVLLEKATDWLGSPVVGPFQLKRPGNYLKTRGGGSCRVARKQVMGWKTLGVGPGFAWLPENWQKKPRIQLGFQPPKKEPHRCTSCMAAEWRNNHPSRPCTKEVIQSVVDCAKCTAGFLIFKRVSECGSHLKWPRVDRLDQGISCARGAPSPGAVQPASPIFPASFPPPWPPHPSTNATYPLGQNGAAQLWGTCQGGHTPCRFFATYAPVGWEGMGQEPTIRLLSVSKELSFLGGRH